MTAVKQSDHETLVLHVDDNPNFGTLMEDSLEKQDDTISVITTTTASEGLDILSTEEIDCIVSDYQMPGMDGIEFLRKTREEYPNLPFFLCTGRGSEEVASEAIEAGVTSYIKKRSGLELFERLSHRIQNAVTRREAERRASIARDRLLELYEQTDGFYIFDEDWTIQYWNQQMVQRTGRSVEDVLEEPFLEAFPEAEGTELYTNYQVAMEKREAVEFETFYEPNQCWIEVNVFPVDEGLFVHSRDITDDKERELELDRRNQILESFANTVSHDLRNPLRIAEGRLKLAQKTGDFEHLEEVAQAHNRMQNLIDELLNVVRGNDDSLTTVSLAESVTEAWTTVTSDDAEIVVEDDMTVQAYETQLRRLLENLFWNALDHGQASLIRVGMVNENVLYIEDDGVGIPKTEQESIFDSGFSTKEGNPGYGLSIVRRICDAHGWKISVTNGEQGGARFELRGIELAQ